MSIDPEVLMAYADGELGPIEAKRVERAIAADPALAREVERHRLLRARLDGHFAAVAQEPVPDHLTTLIRASVVDLPTQRRTPRVRAWAPWGGAVAAALVLGLFVGKGLPDRSDVRARDGGLYAAGSLAGALDQPLAANDAPVQLIVSFRDRQGRYCRVFKAAPADGIACHDRSGWALRQTVAHARAPHADYAQAGSTDADLMAAAQEMMAGDPLDQQQAARAAASGWR